MKIKPILFTIILAMMLTGCSQKTDEITLKIGAQNYAEVIIMAYMAEALIEDQTVYQFVSEKSIEALKRQWIEPLGYENTYAITVRRSMAEEYNLKTISDLFAISSELIIGMDDAYMEREIDGYKPLLATYELKPFKRAITMQINLLYQAIRDEQVDVGVAYSSDARVHAYDLVWLEDDRNLYPPFEAAYAVNLSALEKAPEIVGILSQLSGKIDIETIRKLNYEADINQRDHKEVAIEFLKNEGFLND